MARKAQPGTACTFGERHPARRRRPRDLALRQRRDGGSVQHTVPQLGFLRGPDHGRGQVGNVGKRMRLVRASHHLQRAPGEDGGHHALAGVGHPDAGAEEIARHHGYGACCARFPRPQQRGADAALAALRLPRAVFRHHLFRSAVGVKAFRKDDDGARLACRRQDRLFGGRKFAFPGRGAVRENRGCSGRPMRRRRRSRPARGGRRHPRSASSMSGWSGPLPDRVRTRTRSPRAASCSATVQPTGPAPVTT